MRCPATCPAVSKKTPGGRCARAASLRSAPLEVGEVWAVWWDMPRSWRDSVHLTGALPLASPLSPLRSLGCAVGRCHASEECAVLLVELLHSPNPAVLLAAAEALLDLTKVGALHFLYNKVKKQRISDLGRMYE